MGTAFTRQPEHFLTAVQVALVVVSYLGDDVAMRLVIDHDPIDHQLSH
jgi:hypothetical protein